MAKSKILLVEDDPNARDMLCALLDLKGFEVYTAENGAQALEMLGSLRPEVIVTDMRMPLIAGDDLIKTIRQREDLADVPIIVLTAFKKDFVMAALAAGATEVLEKPMGVSQLVGTIKKVLSSYE